MTIEEIQIDTLEKLVKFHENQIQHWVSQPNEPGRDKILLHAVTELIKTKELLKEV